MSSQLVQLFAIVTVEIYMYYMSTLIAFDIALKCDSSHYPSRNKQYESSYVTMDISFLKITPLFVRLLLFTFLF